MSKLSFGFCLILLSLNAFGQMRPMFIGGPPGITQFQAISLQRHQARALRYREAIEELKKNPKAADIAVCAPGLRASEGECLLPPSALTSSVALPSNSPPIVSVDELNPIATHSAAQSPSLPSSQVPVIAEQPKPEMKSLVIGRRLALLIGNNNYTMPIPSLDTPLTDVTRIGKVLEDRFGYKSKILKDAGKTETISALNALVADARPEDAVLIFYAGHGYQMTDTGMGFWIPPDATVKTARGWISNDDIARLLSAISSRQIILVSDSCFSGTLAKEKKIKSTGKIDAGEVLSRRSVMVMTSGDEEPVSDEGKEGHSIFAWNLIRTLEATGDVTPGFEVWRSVHSGVRKEYPQEAQYGAVVSAGHAEGGEFIFTTAK